MITVDSHFHSKYSHDSEAEFSDIVATAVERGIKTLVSTDHAGVYQMKTKIGKDHMLMPHRKQDFPAIKEEFASLVELINGVEIGEAIYDLDFADRLVADGNYDQIIGSMHFTKSGGEISEIVHFPNFNAKEFIDSYFSDIAEIVAWGKFDILAHLTFPFRYLHTAKIFSIAPLDYTCEITEIFKMIIQKGIALEVNTSGLHRYKSVYGKTDPWFDIIKLYKSVGGELISIGSDAHQSCFIGGGFDVVEEFLKDIGYKSYVYFKKRKAIVVDF